MTTDGVERALAALEEAERRGVRQIFGQAQDDQGGRCASQVLVDARVGKLVLHIQTGPCPVCQAETVCRFTHLNDKHRLSFREIAQTMRSLAA